MYLLLVLKDADLTNYNDDNTLYGIIDNISKVFFELEITIEKLLRWSAENQMKIIKNVTGNVNLN